MEEAKRNLSLPLIVAVVLGVAILAGLLFYLRHPGPPPATAKLPEKLPPPGPAEQQYISRIEIADLELSQFENFLGQTVTYVEGHITNRGTRSLTALELTFEFKDLLNQTVLRETVRVIGRRSPPLGPGVARTFRFGFDNLPADWGRRAPEIRVTGLALQ